MQSFCISSLVNVEAPDQHNAIMIQVAKATYSICSSLILINKDLEAEECDATKA